jgi:outer membrane protein assembly factor BamB
MNMPTTSVASSSPQKRSLFGKIAIFLLLIAGPARWIIAKIDHGEANLTFGLCVLFGALLGWFALLRSTVISKWAKVLFTAAPIALGAVGLFRYQFVGFSGEIVPRFKLRGNSTSEKYPSMPRNEMKTPVLDEVNTFDAPLQGEFTQFLGNQRNGRVDGLRLSSDWQSKPPKILWKNPIGAGWSGFAVKSNLAVTTEEHAGEDCVVALHAQTGELVWRTKLGRKHYHPLGGGGPRATPTIADDRVYVQSSTGIVAAIDLSDGTLHWTVDLLSLAKITQSEAEAVVTWGRSGSPLVVDEMVIVPFGGKSGESPGSLIALNRRDGTEKWRGGTDQVSYSSPSMTKLHGENQIVIVNESSVSGHHPQDGTMLWQFDWPGQSNGGASVSQTISIDEEHLFLSKSYHVGSMLLDFSKSLPNATIVGTVWKNAGVLKTKFSNAVLHNGFLYGLSDGIMECIRADDGKKMWKDGKNGRFGHGQILLVDEHILVSAEDGRCVLLHASPDKLQILGEVSVVEGVTWNPLSIVGDHVFMRNGVEAACLLVPLADE